MVNYLVLDIETGYANQSDINHQLKQWSPPSNIKDPEKIASRRAEAELKIRDKVHCQITPQLYL
jgi:hypothetical protein